MNKPWKYDEPLIHDLVQGTDLALSLTHIITIDSRSKHPNLLKFQFYLHLLGHNYDKDTFLVGRSVSQLLFFLKTVQVTFAE